MNNSHSTGDLSSNDSGSCSESDQKIKKPYDEHWWQSYERICFWVLFGLGVLARSRLYFANLSLWNDEAALATNLVHRGFLDLLRPLDYSQMAPIGFCWIERLAVVVLGNSEYTLRLVPFLAGIAALPLAYILVRKTLGIAPALVCLAMLAVSKIPIRYAAELKHYSLDLAITLGLLLMAWNVMRYGVRSRQFLLLAFSGIIAVWFSFTSAFILGGIGCCLSVMALRRKQWADLLLLGFTGVCWLLSFYTEFHLLNSYFETESIMEDFWTTWFMPLPPKSIEDLKWFLTTMIEVFKNPVKISWPPLMIAMFLTGCVLMWQKNQRFLCLLLLPILFNLLASGLHKYPFGDRMLIYGLPSFVIPIALSVTWLWSHKEKWFRIAGIVLLIVILAEPSANMMKRLVVPKKREELRPVLAYVAQRQRPGDTIFLLHNSNIAFLFYRDRYGLNENELILSKVSTPQNLNKLPDDLDKLRGRPRVWLLFGHGWKWDGVNMEKVILEAVDKIGRPLDRIKETGAAGYLYEFH